MAGDAAGEELLSGRAMMSSSLRILSRCLRPNFRRAETGKAGREGSGVALDFRVFVKGEVIGFEIVPASIGLRGSSEPSFRFRDEDER